MTRTGLAIPRKVTIGNQTVKRVAYCKKVLEVQGDEFLSWEKHIDYEATLHAYAAQQFNLG